MKKVLTTIFLAIVSIQCFCQLGYRYGNSFKTLTPDTLCFFVQTMTKERMNYFKNNSSQSLRKVNIFAELSENSCIVDSKPAGGDDYVSEIFRDEENHKIIILPRLAIKMKKNHDVREILKAFDGILLFDKDENNVSKFNCKLKTASEVLELSNVINEMECVEWSEPMMIGEAVSYNTFYSSQYYLYNTGQTGGTTGIDINVKPAWDIVSVDTTIIVAVLDDGVERNHEDLYGSVLDGMTIDYSNEKGDPKNDYYNYTYYDYESLSYKTVSDTKAHGTACAGIIAAHNNNIGIRGVASGVKILPININPYNYPLAMLSYPTVWYEKIGQAIYWAYNTKHADVISCSWGFSDNTYISNALNDAMSYGREGKGTIVVCSSGNDDSDTSVRFPANMTGTIAVGAIDNTGVIWDYSCRGSSLDLVAPSGNGHSTSDVVTTDRMGINGYNSSSGVSTDLSDTNYTQRFNGTSASCPQVTGVAALILSLRPDLSADQVTEVLRETAHDLGPAGRDNTYGYGLVDAYAALCSIDYSIIGPTVLCDTATYYITNLPSGYTVSWTLDNNHFSISPSGYQCLVSRVGAPQYAISNLVASVSWNGHTVKTLTKRIVAHGTDMLVYGEQAIPGPGGGLPEINSSFYIPASAGSGLLRSNGASMMSSDTLTMHPIPILFEESNGQSLMLRDDPEYGITEIYGDAATLLTSDRFDGMTISFTGDKAPVYVTSNGSTTVGFKFQPASILTDVQGYYNMVLHATSPGGCSDFDLYFKVIPQAGGAVGDDAISLSVGSTSLEVTFNNFEMIDLGNGVFQNVPWTLSIYKMATNTLVHSSVNYDMTKTVSMSGWTSGIYLVRVDCNGQRYSKKFLK